MRRLLAVVALAVTASACGAAGGGTASASPSPSPAETSPSPIPSPSGLSFRLNGINTPASGTIMVRPGPSTVTIELVITGLAADSSHVAHIHVGSCAQHGNIALALNQVIADGQGNADTRSTLNTTYPPSSETWYVVVHAGPDMQGTNASYLLCGNLFA